MAIGKVRRGKGRTVVYRKLRNCRWNYENVFAPMKNPPFLAFSLFGCGKPVEQKKERLLRHMQMGHAYVQMGNYRDAIASFQRAVELNPEAGGGLSPTRFPLPPPEGAAKGAVDGQRRPGEEA